MTTLAALYLFKQLNLDLVILEVGMGGRLDAVNIIDSDVAIITSIGLDHCEWLGNTREQIAFEKLGIARRHHPLICGDFNPPENIEVYCKTNNISLFQINHHFKIEEGSKHWKWHSSQKYLDCLPLPKILISNAACVLQAVECLSENFIISEETIRKILPLASQPGRLQQEKIKEKTVVFDVSHNPDAVKQLRNYLLNNFTSLQTSSLSAAPSFPRKWESRNDVTLHPNLKLHAVFGLLADKDIDAIFNLTKDLFSTWHISEINSSRSYLVDTLKQKSLHHNLPHCYFYGDIQIAFEQALKTADPDDWIVVFGSFYLLAHYWGLQNNVATILARPISQAKLFAYDLK